VEVTSPALEIEISLPLDELGETPLETPDELGYVLLETTLIPDDSSEAEVDVKPTLTTPLELILVDPTLLTAVETIPLELYAILAALELIVVAAKAIAVPVDEL
jgi:hypothetical protein